MWRRITGVAKSLGKAVEGQLSVRKVVDAVTAASATAVTTASAIAATATNAASTIAATTSNSLNSNVTTSGSKNLVNKATEAVRAHLPSVFPPTSSSSSLSPPPPLPITSNTTDPTTTSTSTPLLPKKPNFIRRSYSYIIGSAASSAATAMAVASRGTLVAGTAVRGAATDAINATLGNTIGKVFKWTVGAICAIAFAYGVGRSLPDAVARVLVDDSHHSHTTTKEGTHDQPPKHSSL